MNRVGILKSVAVTQPDKPDQALQLQKMPGRRPDRKDQVLDGYAAPADGSDPAVARCEQWTAT